MDKEPDTEKKIFEAARAVFIERGFAGSRMQDIADRAGINKAMLHYYFRSKDLLFESVFRGVAPHVFGSIALAFSGDEPLPAKVEKLVHTYLDLMSEQPFVVGFVLSEMSRNPGRLQEIVRPLVPFDTAQLSRQIEEEVQAGRMRPISTEQFIVNLLGLCVFPFLARPMLGAILGVEGDRFDAFVAERRATLADFFLNGLRP